MIDPHRRAQTVGVLLVGALWAGIVGNPAGVRGQDVTGDQVKIAIDNAVRSIRRAQGVGGGWPEYGRQGGNTALNLLALLAAGVPEPDPAVRRGLEFLAKVPNQDTYVVALKCMVYRYADPRKYNRPLTEAAAWLVAAQLAGGAWGYNKMAGGAGYVGDNSNTQFALLGLHEAANAGVKVPQAVWTRSEKHFLNSQLRDGSWQYRADLARVGTGYGSMTCAAIASLYITGNQLHVAQERGYVNGAGANCGQYRQNRAIATGLNWLADNFSVQHNPGRAATWKYYYLYALERVGMISGRKFLGPHDWYRQGAAMLVGEEKGRARWLAPYDTAFALLFLAKGDKPVLFNKLAWGEGDSWNQDRNDIEHLVGRINAADGFSEAPVGWQIVTLQAPLVELMDAPILFFNGHVFPNFTDAERAKLKDFVEQGGTIFAEACCSRKEFAEGFRRFAGQTWPDYPLQRLGDDHPVFTSFYADLKGNPWQLEGLQVGCRTSVLFAPKDLSCLWEQQSDRLSPDAFKLGTNIAAYATGLERLKGKLARARVADRAGGGSGGDKPGDVVRGALHIGVLAHSTSPVENLPDAGALPKFADYLRDQARIDVVTRPVIMDPTDPELLNHPIMFMTGHNGFDYSDEQVKAVRTWLDRGGFLYANACCGRDNANYRLPGDQPLTNDFGTSFRRLVERLYADQPAVKLLELPLDHPIRGTLKGYFPLEQVAYRPELAKKLAAADPADAHRLCVEGVIVDGRLAVVYSRYAVTCGLEDHKCFNCRGLVSEDAYRLSTNVLLYALSN